MSKLSHVNATQLASVSETLREMKEVFEQKRLDVSPLIKSCNKISSIIDDMNKYQYIRNLLHELEQHDAYTYRHSIGVAMISRFIGEALQLTQCQLNELTWAALLHDVGKLNVPDEIINKISKLSYVEYKLMQYHTEIGFEMIRHETGVAKRVAIVALQHHEREDGSGYPYRLRAEQIDPMSKIVAVADVFHALITKRIYKDAIPLRDVMNGMKQNSYGILDMGTVMPFLNRLASLMMN